MMLVSLSHSVMLSVSARRMGSIVPCSRAFFNVFVSMLSVLLSELSIVLRFCPNPARTIWKNVVISHETAGFSNISTFNMADSTFGGGRKSCREIDLMMCGFPKV